MVVSFSTYLSTKRQKSVNTNSLTTGSVAVFSVRRNFLCILSALYGNSVLNRRCGVLDGFGR